MRILISGAGIAGPALAYWLLRCGMTPTIVEMAPRLRTGGYIIDFWGAGYEVAGRMGLLSEIEQAGYRVKRIRVVGKDSGRVVEFSAHSFARITQGRFTSIPRGDLAATIFRSIEGKAETIFGDTIAAIEQDARGVRVKFRSGVEREFDLVVGADGLHSRVRQLVFGEERQFEKYLGIKAAAFQARGYQRRDELVYVMFTEVGQQVVRFAMRGDRTVFFITFLDEAGVVPESLEGQKAELRQKFGKSGGEGERMLEALDRCEELYFDRVSQIRMNADGAGGGAWSRGRVALAGDAASCVSLLAGQGSALAMVAAYILAGELKTAAGNYPEAFRKYEERFGPFVAGKQKAALRFAGWFAPKSRAALFARNQLFRLLNVPWIADWSVRGDFADRIELPEY
ncbi:MAG TPA: FAD-binding domain [Candidatus Acidoferrum sp.]|nr:FAD-binding domain [Candidatus Acidoferrum sp.]